MLIETRRAADLLGATKMDRPEDIEANPQTNRVYVMLTNNTRRKDEQVDAANPRANNAFGHIVEMMPDGGDHAATGFTWEVLVKCGDPSVAAVGATFSSETTKNGWFGMPDNCAIDSQGRLWISTDGNNAKATGRADGLWALETEGELRGTSKHFFRVPVGAEMCGPFFTPERRDAVPRRAASRRSGGRRPGELRQSDHPLAGLQGRHAAAPVGARHHQAGRRQDRLADNFADCEKAAKSPPFLLSHSG